MDRLADVFEACIAQKSSGQQAGLAKNLKSVTNSEHQAAAVRKLPDRFHHRREFCNCPSPQIIAIRKATGNNDCIAILQIMRVVPQESNRLPGDLLDGPKRVVIAVRSGEDDDTKLHSGDSNRMFFRIKLNFITLILLNSGCDDWAGIQ